MEILKMMTIDMEKCIGCGACIKDCTVKDIEMIGTKASMKNKNCFKCGHCIAVCPTNAVSMDEYDMTEVIDYRPESFDIPAENLLNFIKFRRSVRQFTSQVVESEKIEKIIEAGRFTQTGVNSQDVSYIVVQDNIQELRALTLESLKDIGQHILANLSPENMNFANYAKLWVKAYETYMADPNSPDRLFFNAPTLIVVTAKSSVNGALASSNMELMTNTLGLATFFSGFLARAAMGNKKIKDFLQIEDEKEIVTCLVVGYPKVKYKRTAPRKKADITWK
jgi:nitroreductase/NAD-dependent dihydropyrimidine dehydrogenase PreA subunit